MDTEHRVIAELLALTEAPDDVLLDQVEAIGERAARHMLSDEAGRLWHADRQTAMDCIAVIDRIDVLIRPGPASPPGYPVPLGCVLHGGVDLRRDIPQHDLDLLRGWRGFRLMWSNWQ